MTTRCDRSESVRDTVALASPSIVGNSLRSMAWGSDWGYCVGPRERLIAHRERISNYTSLFNFGRGGVGAHMPSAIGSRCHLAWRFTRVYRNLWPAQLWLPKFGNAARAFGAGIHRATQHHRQHAHPTVKVDIVSGKPVRKNCHTSGHRDAREQKPTWRTNATSGMLRGRDKEKGERTLSRAKWAGTAR